MSSSSLALTSLLSGVGTLLSLGIEVALLVVALTVVRPRRPDAFLPFVIGAVINALSTVGWPIASILVGVVAARSGVGDIGAAYAVLGLCINLLRAAAWGAILFGIVRLASPQDGARYDPTRYQ